MCLQRRTYSYPQDVIYHVAQSAHLAPLKEEWPLLPGLRGQHISADVLLLQRAGCLHEAMDICVVSSLQGQYVEQAAEDHAML